ncbi:MAG: sigma-70 family RNA polymerase sigma factor [Schwartzia sp.]|nr:sigma-70 family RNA polymerase sigma factor [Schwartzia sp. (in: firmicutes)]
MIKEYDDVRLAAMAQAGDDDAMAELYARYEGLIVKCSHMPYLRTIADDAMGEAMEIFVRSVRSFDASRGVPFPGFMKSMIEMGLYSFFKRERRKWEREVMPFAGEDGETALDKIADMRDAIGELESEAAFDAMLDGLTPRVRAVMEMLYRDGLTQQETARRLGVSQQAVAAMKSRSIKSIREKIA